MFFTIIVTTQALMRSHAKNLKHVYKARQIQRTTKSEHRELSEPLNKNILRLKTTPKGTPSKSTLSLDWF